MNGGNSIGSPARLIDDRGKRKPRRQPPEVAQSRIQSDEKKTSSWRWLSLPRLKNVPAAIPNSRLYCSRTIAKGSRSSALASFSTTSVAGHQGALAEGTETNKTDEQMIATESDVAKNNQADDAQRISYSLGALFARQVILRYVDSRGLGDKEFDKDAFNFKKLVPEMERASASDKCQREDDACDKGESEALDIAKIIEEANGDPATAIRVRYKQLVADPESKDFQKGEPKDRIATFKLNDGVIDGWLAGIRLMQQFDEYEFVIPPELAYGRHGASGKKRVIAGDEILRYRIKLL